jgi:hypothetical protein
VPCPQSLVKRGLIAGRGTLTHSTSHAMHQIGLSCAVLSTPQIDSSTTLLFIQHTLTQTHLLSVEHQPVCKLNAAQNDHNISGCVMSDGPSRILPVNSDTFLAGGSVWFSKLFAICAQTNIIPSCVLRAAISSISFSFVSFKFLFLLKKTYEFPDSPARLASVRSSLPKCADWRVLLNFFKFIDPVFKCFLVRYMISCWATTFVFGDLLHLQSEYL